MQRTLQGFERRSHAAGYRLPRAASTLGTWGKAQVFGTRILLKSPAINRLTCGAAMAAMRTLHCSDETQEITADFAGRGSGVQAKPSHLLAYPQNESPFRRIRGDSALEDRTMQVVAFSEFARRRAARGLPDIPADAGLAIAALDLWASRHSPEIMTVEPVAETDEFWSDLQFRLAYPTHRLRQH